MRTSFKRLFACCALLLAPNAWALNLFACEPEYAALAQELAPEARIFSATTALQDPHQIQARPSLIAQMRRADLAICAGAELEVGWLPMLQMKANNPKVRDGLPGMFYAAEQVDTLDRLDSVSRDMGDVHAEGNPHLHFSPQRLLRVAQVLTERLAQLDPTNAEHYRANFDDFSARWLTAIPVWEAKAAPLHGQAVIAYHSSFRYLFDWLGVEQAGDLEPKPGLPPSTAHLAGLLALTEQQTIMAVVHAGYQDRRGAQWLAQRAELPVVRLPFSTGQEGIDSLFALYDAVLEPLLAHVGE
ncbi:metal ABC transporter solute-binding protein, Zn/Mn family [Ferrimonas pelagia]|uniref:Zinc ABC transporter substrate-binding protein n=1 Tax=Ferrimonas pelagia TaxID=1177826 RepID=A0ABP9E828_9GAMM